MSYRCINAFWLGDKVYTGGLEVADDDPILETHRAHFAHVQTPAGRSEVASAAPQESRTVSTVPKKAPAKKAAPKKAADPEPPTGEEPEEGSTDA